jgi:hypothetical protein
MAKASGWQAAAGPKDVNREAELKWPTGVGSSDPGIFTLLAVI